MPCLVLKIKLDIQENTSDRRFEQIGTKL
jgi:hypothetical protein